jgi:peroxiredoxin
MALRMVPVPLAILIDGPMALYIVWVAFSVALIVIAAIWIFRPALAELPFKRLGVVWLVLTVVVGLVSWRVFSRNRPIAGHEPHYAMAPNFAFRTVDGRSISRDSVRGKVVLIEFWASWCGPCRESLPEMFRLYHQFSGSRFMMIGVSEDQDQTKFEDFVAQMGIRWPQDWDPNGAVAGRFSAGAIPSYEVIDADGHLLFSQKGYNDETFFHITQVISTALGENRRLAEARP